MASCEIETAILGSQVNRRPLSIIYVAPFDLSTNAGHSSHVLSTVKQMVRKGNKITLIAIACPDEVARTLNFVPLKIIECPLLRTASFGARCAVAIRRIIRQYRPDVVYARFFTSVLLPIIPVRARRIPVVLEVNSSLSNERKGSGRNRLTAFISRLEERAALRRVSAIVAVSASVAEDITELVPVCGRRIHVIENGVDTRIFYPRSRLDCSVRHGLDVHRQRIVFAGSFQEWQGLLDLLAAFEVLSQKSHLVELLLIGDGPLRGQIEQFIEDRELTDRVRILGFVTEDKMAELICASDVAVAPYNSNAVDGEPIRGARMRGSPLKIFSYLACGLPIVASHFCEAGIFIEEAAAGKSCLPDNSTDLANTLSEVLSNDGEARAMGERGRRIAKELYDWSGVVDRYLDVVAFAAKET
jgi:glycosyltransferase involved in cell wall biosynthesis